MLTWWAVEVCDRGRMWLLLVEHHHLVYCGCEPSELSWLQAPSPRIPLKVQSGLYKHSERLTIRGFLNEAMSDVFSTEKKWRLFI